MNRSLLLCRRDLPIPRPSQPPPPISAHPGQRLPFMERGCRTGCYKYCARAFSHRSLAHALNSTVVVRQVAKEPTHKENGG
uniref:Uncharacterized protein n=1 Tax=Knipowitschia caucasica TaxID=637954 RepID=A0AAV2LFL5_KNICA